MLTDMECAILVEVLHVYLESINKKRSVTQKVTLLFLFISLNGYLSYFTSSKTTPIDYQCVSTRCCTHVAKSKISIDNQHVTKSMQRYNFLPK